MVKEREEFVVIGKNLPKVEGEEKVRGEYKFAGDIFLPSMLHCKILRSPHAHALVKRVDTKRAEKLQGVKAVITHKDVPLLSMRGFLFLPMVMTRDHYILEKEVRYVGDRVAAVAATSPEIAEEALSLIKVDYEELPAVFDPLKAMEPDAPPVHKVIRRGDEEVKVDRNIVAPVHLNIGDVEEGFKQADLVVGNEFKTQRVHNATLGRPVILCRPLRGGRLEVWTHTQSIHAARMNLATSLGLPRSKVKVHRLYLGGAFGHYMHTGYIDAICGFLALRTGLPVRAEESREEMFLNGGRHHQIIRLKTGVRKDGTLTAMHMEVVANAGAYAVAGESIPALEGGFFMSMYRCPNLKYDAYTVYTNTPPSGVMRGVGNPQNFAVEQQMDIIAEKLDVDPLELRLKNHIRTGDIFYGQGPDVLCVVQSCGTEQLIKEGAKLIGWEHRRAITPYQDKPWIKRGIGMARGFHTSGAGAKEPSNIIIDFSEAIVKMNEDGTASLIGAFADSGSGGLSALAAIAAEELGLRYEDIIVAEGDTDTTLFDIGTHASRAVYCQGLAVQNASAKTKKTILEWASRILKFPADQLEVKDRCIYLKTEPSTSLISLQDVLETAQYRDWGTAVGTASVRAPACPPHFTVLFIEVDVDTRTGEAKLVRAVGGADVGTPVNLQAVLGQNIGGIHMGLGFALTEETLIDPNDGCVLNPNFTDYKFLTPLDMPKVQTILADTYEPTGPFGAKGIGEGAANHVAAAVANAIYNAVGVRTYSTPMTPEKILDAIRKQQK